MKELTVGELRDILAGYDEDLPVRIAYPYGDYWNTTVASEAGSVVSEEFIWSDYHDNYTIGERDDEDEDQKTMEGVAIYAR